MAGLYDAFKLGLRSHLDDAARAAFAREAAETLKTTKANAAVTGGMSATELAEAYPKLQREAENFIQDFHSAYKQPEYSDMPEAMAYGTGRKLGGVRDSVGGMVQSMGGVGGVALQGAFIAPMFMSMGGGVQEQLQPELQQSDNTQDYDERLARRHRLMQFMQQQGYGQ